MELSPRLSRSEQSALAFWIRRLPAALAARLPAVKLAAAERLGSTRASVLIDPAPGDPGVSFRNHLHAASYVPERYIVLRRNLFRRRVELGRILYHELCHFLWPRLGNPKRQEYERMLRREFREKVRGELGYSAEWRKARLQKTATEDSHRDTETLRASRSKNKNLQPNWKESPRRILWRSKAWREYVCESFCDTGSFVLLGRERRARHSEYTLGRGTRQRRSRRWAVLTTS